MLEELQPILQQGRAAAYLAMATTLALDFWKTHSSSSRMIYLMGTSSFLSFVGSIIASGILTALPKEFLNTEKKFCHILSQTLTIGLATGVASALVPSAALEALKNANRISEILRPLAVSADLSLAILSIAVPVETLSLEIFSITSKNASKAVIPSFALATSLVALRYFSLNPVSVGIPTGLFSATCVLLYQLLPLELSVNTPVGKMFLNVRYG